jgi:hypothetical protein
MSSSFRVQVPFRLNVRFDQSIHNGLSTLTWPSVDVVGDEVGQSFRALGYQSQGHWFDTRIE